MDTSAREAMKDAAKCDKHCDLQISANQQISERIMRKQGYPWLQVCFSVFEPLISPWECDSIRFLRHNVVRKRQNPRPGGKPWYHAELMPGGIEGISGFVFLIWDSPCICKRMIWGHSSRPETHQTTRWI